MYTKRFFSETKGMDRMVFAVDLTMNTNGTDAVGLSITPCTKDEKTNSFRFYNDRKQYASVLNFGPDTFSDGRPNNRHLKNFCNALEKLIKLKKGNFSFNYKDKITNNVKNVLIGIGNKTEVPTFNVAMWTGDNPKTSLIYTFKDEKEICEFLKFLKVFKSPRINEMLHIVISSVEETIRKSFGEQMRLIIADEIQKALDQNSK